MSTSAEIDAFLSLKTCAVAGASRHPAKYGYRVYRLLKQCGYQVYPINPKTSTIDGETCYASLAALPIVPDGVALITPPEESLSIVQEAARLGIRHIWLQPGAGSAAVLRACREHGQQVVAGECLLTLLPHGLRARK